MKQLIPLQQHIVGSETIQTVNARELHVFLGVKEDFTHWIKRRISVYQFLEDIDFTKLVVSNAGTISPTEYHISLDMAKQLAMVERTAKGKEARLYFLECERLVMRQQLQPPAIDRYSDLKAIVDLAHSVAEQRQEMAQLRAEQDRQRTQLLETQQTAIMALTGQQWVTIRQYVAIYDLHRQLPPSEQRAYATYLKGVSLERGIPVYKANTADAAWPQENTYFAGLIHETLLPWLTMRQSQSILLPPTEDIL